MTFIYDNEVYIGETSYSYLTVEVGRSRTRSAPSGRIVAMLPSLPNEERYKQYPNVMLPLFLDAPSNAGHG